VDKWLKKFGKEGQRGEYANGRYLREREREKKEVKNRLKGKRDGWEGRECVFASFKREGGKRGREGDRERTEEGRVERGEGKVE